MKNSMPSCNCTDCGGKRQKGPCTHEILEEITVACDCTDCGGKRVKGPCMNETKIESISTISLF